MLRPLPPMFQQIGFLHDLVVAAQQAIKALSSHKGQRT